MRLLSQVFNLKWDILKTEGRNNDPKVINFESGNGEYILIIKKKKNTDSHSLTMRYATW